MEDIHKKTDKSGTLSRWIKRFGVAGLLFFTIKGLVWLAIFIAAGWAVTC